MNDNYLQEKGQPLDKKKLNKIISKFKKGGYHYWIAKQHLLDFITFADDDDLIQLKRGNLTLNKFYKLNPTACIVIYANNLWVNVVNLPDDVRNCIIRDFNKEFRNTKSKRKHYLVPTYRSEDGIVHDVQNNLMEWYELNGMSESNAILEAHKYILQHILISNNMNPYLGYNERFCWFK